MGACSKPNSSGRVPVLPTSTGTCRVVPSSTLAAMVVGYTRRRPAGRARSASVFALLVTLGVALASP